LRSCLKGRLLGWLEIDRSFVRDVLSDSDDATITRTIVVLAQSLEPDTIVEDVEIRAERLFGN